MSLFLPGLDVRFQYFTIDSDTGCWIWNNFKDGSYVQVNDPECVGKRVLVHRYIYEWVFGPLPKHILLHHICERPRCVSPNHMKPVTQSEHQKLHKAEAKRMKAVMVEGVLYL